MCNGRCIRVPSPRRCLLFLSLAIILTFLLLHLFTWSVGYLQQYNDAVLLESESAESFLNRYKNFCESYSKYSRRKKSAALTTRNYLINSTSLSLCDCVPKSIIGSLEIEDLTRNVSTRTGEKISHDELINGGQWSPNSCTARQTVAIIIPYRDRPTHLSVFLSVLHPMLQRQQLKYSIFVVEQLTPLVFNKALLMNAAFTEVRSLQDFDCFIFHDVDMIPLDDRGFYTCSYSPHHLGAFVDKWDFSMLYYGIFGGVTAFTREQFELVNGFSNQYYGWGGEDDDIYRRVKSSGMQVERFPRSVSRYSMIKHSADKKNPFNTRANQGTRFFSADLYSRDGLSSLNYTIQTVQPKPGYTWIAVHVPPAPVEHLTFDRNSERFINIVTVFLLLFLLLALVLLHHRFSASVKSGAELIG